MITIAPCKCTEYIKDINKDSVQIGVEIKKTEGETQGEKS